MKNLQYQQTAVNELTDKTIKLLNLGGSRKKIVFEAPTGAGKTVMACQMLANLVDELKYRGDSPYQEAAFIWIAPRKLHLQSYASLKGAFSETRRLRPVMFDELEQSEGIQPGEILFVNWESINKKGNVMVRDSESSASLFEITRKTREEQRLPIVVIIDEEHMFWSKTADKSAEVLNQINPTVEIRISATPKTLNPDEVVRVYRQYVIDAEMIKREVVLNPDIELNFNNNFELNVNLIKAALEKRQQIADAYQALGVNINPLLLIQLPNDTKETMTAEDEAIAEQVKHYLDKMCDINVENGKMAIWLSNEKENLTDLEKPDNLAQVLLFKEAIALGWDCPRAAVLLIFRKVESASFTIQTVGRILRMPEQKHYPNELLNNGYVYTDVAKEKIQIVAEDANYLLNHSIIAHRRENLTNVALSAYYSERPNVERNYLGPDFRRFLMRTALEFWKLDQNTGNLFSNEELLAMLQQGDDFKILEDTGDADVDTNRRKVSGLSQNAIRLDVKNVNIPIPKDVHFQNEVQTIEVDQIQYARKPSELRRVFAAYISTKGGQFESKGRTDKISTFLLDVISDLFGLMDVDAMKVVLYHENKPKFDRLLELALSEYAEKRAAAKGRSQQLRQLKEYTWEVPEERVYDDDTHHEEQAYTHALQPFVELKTASSPEKRFVAFLESNKQYIDWWYKNGDKGKQHYAIPYGEEKNRSLFYVDFVIRMKNGHIYLFDTKSEGSDIAAPQKHNALLEYIKENTKEDAVLGGGVIVEHNNNWLYSRLPIENTTDTTNWDSFYPENA